MSYIDVTGKTEAEAIEKALLQLNLDRDDVSVEILERARTGFLGIGASPAKVRVTYGEEETAAVELGRKPLFTPEKIAEKKAVEEKPAKKPAARPAAPVDKDSLRRELASKQEVFQNAPKQDKPAEGEKRPRGEKRGDRRERAPRAEKAPRAPREVFVPVYEGTEAAADDAKANEIKTFLTGLLQQMDCGAEVRVFEKEKNQYKVYLEGEKLGQLIGRRGETLDAIQQLTNYSVNRGSGPRVRVHVDAENYRSKREESLESLAQKMAQKVVKYGRSMTLEPMNAYERHVIHTALQEHPRVTTYSTGTEPNRRVVIAIDRTKAQ